MRQDSDINRGQWNIIKIIEYQRLQKSDQLKTANIRRLVFKTNYNLSCRCPSPFSLNKIPNGTFLHIITFIQLVVRKFSFKGSPIYFVQS